MDTLRNPIDKQHDLFLKDCPDCKGSGRRLLSFAVNPRRKAIRVVVIKRAEDLKPYDLPILPPDCPSSLWGDFRLVYRPMGRGRARRADDFEYASCGRCRGTGKQYPQYERQYRRWLRWRQKVNY